MFFAYLDAGSGSLLLQLILGGAAGVAVFFKSMGRSIFRRKKPAPAEANTTSPD